MTEHQKWRSYALSFFHGFTGYIFERHYVCSTCNQSVKRNWKICPRCLVGIEWDNIPITWRDTF